MFAGIGRIYRAALFGSSGTLSSGRSITWVLVLHVIAAFWLYVGWVGFLTYTDRLEAAAPFANSISQTLAAVMSSTVATVAATWWTTKRYGDNGAASQAQVNDPHATAGASTVPPEPPPVQVVEMPDVNLTVDKPIEVEIVGDQNNPGGI